MSLKSLVFLNIFVLMSGLVHATSDQAPPDFDHKDGKAIFVDFTSSRHELTYDLISKTVNVESVIEFDSSKEGYPIFDLMPDPYDVILNGENITVELVPDPAAQTLFRIAQLKIPAGRHELRMRHSISTNVIFNETGVASAFWLSDLTDRKYLEHYLPSNLEYDQYRKIVNVSIIGGEGKVHTLKANGKVTQLSDSRFEIIYPETYTSSSIFFHLFPVTQAVQNVQFYYPSIDGRLIPVDIYTIVDIQPFVDQTRILLAELESDYGPFPHNQLIIYGNSLVKGGMEYSGATATGLLSLGHELFHSYNARGVMPANGNAGWMDEAMARWRDNGYPMIKDLSFESTRIGGHSAWQRFTDRMAYAEGSAFLSKIAFRMDEKGMSLKGFLKDYYTRNMFTTVTTPQFEKELTEASGLDLSGDFNRYVYGKVSFLKKSRNLKAAKDPHHPNWTKEQLDKMTMP